MRQDGKRITAEADCRLMTNMHVDAQGDSWNDGALILGIAYDIMQLPDPQDDLPRLRKKCHTLIMDALWTLMYPRWMFLNERADRREDVRELLQYQVIQEPTRVTSTGRIVEGAKIKPLEYFDASPFQAAMHLLAPGKTKWVDGLGEVHTFPALDQRKFVPYDDPIMAMEYNAVNHWSKEIIRRSRSAWRAYDRLNNPFKWAKRQRDAVELLEDAYVPCTKKEVLDRKRKARDIMCMLRVRMQLHEIV